MELRGRKLSSPFQPAPEGHNDPEEVMPTRSSSPDNSHTPPIGMPASYGYNNQSRNQPDPDLEGIRFPPRSMSATGGYPELGQCQSEEGDMSRPRPANREDLSDQEPQTSTSTHWPGIACRNKPLPEDPNSQAPGSRVDARLSTFSPEPARLHTSGFRPLLESRHQDVATPGQRQQHGACQPPTYPVHLPLQTNQDNHYVHYHGESVVQHPRARTWEDPNLRCPWIESPDRQNFSSQRNEISTPRTYQHSRYNEMVHRGDLHRTCSPRPSQTSRPWTQNNQPDPCHEITSHVDQNTAGHYREVQLTRQGDHYNDDHHIDQCQVQSQRDNQCTRQRGHHFQVRNPRDIQPTRPWGRHSHDHHVDQTRVRNKRNSQPARWGHHQNDNHADLFHAHSPRVGVQARPPIHYVNAHHEDLFVSRDNSTDRIRDISSPARVRYDEPRPSFPTFNGRSGEWDAFWIQFELLSRRYKWTGDKLVEQLLLSLKGEAMTFVASLSSDIRNEELLLIRALKERFSHTAPAETHRANLSHIRRSSKESLQEYASRVRTLMSKAYPDIGHTMTYEQLLIQHFMNGIQDQTLAYEVLIRQPRTLNEAIDLVSWHECCKETTKKRIGLRHVKTDFEEESYSHSQNYEKCSEEEIDMDIRRLNNRRFITEERLQQVLRDLKRSLGSNNFSREESDQHQHRPNQQNRPPRKVTCYSCGKEGHISPKCPNKTTSDEQLSENFRGLNLMAENQPSC